MKKNILFFLSLILLSSCANHEERVRKNLQTAWQDYFEKDFTQTKPVEVLVVTNRKPKNESFTCDNTQFGVALDQNLRFGVCKINVPKNHVVGEIGVSSDEGNSSPQTLFKVLGANSLLEKDFFSEIKKSQRTPLVFVHGFNVRYQEAVLRAAQIAYDLKYQGPVILFTWPAGAPEGFVKEKLMSETYANNNANARASIEVFKNFLISLQKNDIKVNLIVHSMGHQVVLPALKIMAESNPKKPSIDQLILNAPDFAIPEFRTISANIKKISDRTTLYCSENDKAMTASKAFNGNERLGACAFIKEIDVVNVGSTDDPTLGLGHGYYSSRAVLGDVVQVLLGIDVNKRSFIAKSDSYSRDKHFLRK
ncbi:MAG: alpha/beta hydrolase [Proteobacteria bacterium]|nr:alpha/beta hydrolase [Pseudomonadota bacterium]